MYGAADVALCLDGSEEGTVPVFWGAAETRAFFDMPGMPTHDGMGISEDYAITVSALALPGIQPEAALTVDGGAYLVREIWRIDDGAMRRLTLRKA